MNPEVKQKWLEALRSGKYKQGKHRLRHGDKFCCLGVLCEISGLEYNGSQGDLPRAVRDYAWLPRHPLVPDKFGNKYPMVELAYLNDSGGYGFKRLADLIEKHL